MTNRRWNPIALAVVSAAILFSFTACGDSASHPMEAAGARPAYDSIPVTNPCGVGAIGSGNRECPQVTAAMP